MQGFAFEGQEVLLPCTEVLLAPLPRLPCPHLRRLDIGGVPWQMTDRAHH